MRVLLVHSSFATLGGAELYVLRLASSLTGRGHQVALATRHAPAPGQHDARVVLYRLAGHHLYDPHHPTPRPRARTTRALWHLTDPWLPTSMGDLRAAVRQHRPELVHTHNIQGIGGGALPAIRHQPVVHTVHDYALIDPRTTLARDDGSIRSSPTLPELIRSRVISALHPVSRYVFPAQRVLDLHLARGWNAGAADAVVIPHGWSLEDPSPRSDATPEPQGTGTPLRFVYLGRLDAHKGLPILLEAWQDRPPTGAQLWLYGRGQLETEVRRLAATVPGINYGGFITGAPKRDALDAADVLLFPSMWPETFGLVCAEALLSGTPIMASSQAGPPVLQDGVNGLLTDGTVAGWADAMQRLAQDGVLRQQLSRGARQSRGALDWDAHIDAVEQCYRVTRRLDAGPPRG